MKTFGKIIEQAKAKRQSPALPASYNQYLSRVVVSTVNWRKDQLGTIVGFREDRQMGVMAKILFWKFGDIVEFSEEERHPFHAQTAYLKLVDIS